VAATEDADKQLIDHFALSNNHLFHLVKNLLARLVDPFEWVIRRTCHAGSFHQRDHEIAVLVRSGN
jgi:hypothetical protein